VAVEKIRMNLRLITKSKPDETGALAHTIKMGMDDPYNDQPE